MPSTTMTQHHSTDIKTDLKIENATLAKGLERQTIAIHSGVITEIATNNIQNLFTPFGDGDPLKICTLLAQTLQLGTQERHRLCLEMATTHAAKAIGIPNHRITPGSAADLVILKAASISQVIGSAPSDRTTIKAGNVVSQTRTEQLVKLANRLDK